LELTSVDQYVDNSQKQILWDLLATPADTGLSYNYDLERLASEYPQSGLLQVLLARNGNKHQLRRAAVYFHPRALFKLINHPENLAEVKITDIIEVITAEQESLILTQPESGNDIAADNRLSEPSEVNARVHDNISGDSNEPAEGVIDVAASEHIPEPKVTNHSHFENANDKMVVNLVEEPQIEVQNESSQFTVDEQTEPLTDSLEPKPTEAEPATDTAFEEVPIADNTPEQVENTTTDVAEEMPAEDTALLSGESYRHVSRFSIGDATEDAVPEMEAVNHDIEDEIYDEIVSIEDIGFEAVVSEEYKAPDESVVEVRFSDPTIETGPEEEEASAVLFHQQEHTADPVLDYNKRISDQEDRLILGGIVNADYLSFDKKLDELRSNAHTEVATVNANLNEPAKETQDVTRYNDDTMPYSFMWWLNKTRKEHADTLQPYVSNAVMSQKNGAGSNDMPGKSGPADELQHQYYENILSLTQVSSVSRDAEVPGVEFDPNKKEDVIIERFIHTEPQIKPQPADKLDNENKARKSSEDLNELVTETLARIYTDQMLYHKAIATYKKLIVKFPEKKLYFAAQIEQLERKTN
jgi:hypothetical protein